MAQRLAFALARRELRGGIRGFRIFILCVTLGVSVIAGVGSLSNALVDGLRQDGRKLIGGDVELRLSLQPANAEQNSHLRAAGRVSEVIELRSMARSPDGAKSGLVELKGVDESYPLHGHMKLEADLELVHALKMRDGFPGAVAERGLLNRLKLRVGDQILVGDATYRITAAIVSEPDRAADSFVLGPRLMVAKTSLQATNLIREGSQINYRYRLALPSGANVLTWIEDLKTQFPKAGWRIRDTRNGAPGLRRFIDRMRLFLTLVGLTALLVGGLGISNAVRSFLDGKTGTIAILKCLGAPGRLIFQVYLLLVFAISVFGLAVGLAVGAFAPIALSGLFAGLLPFEIKFSLHFMPMLLATVFGLFTVLAFTIWPLARAKMVPAGALFRDLASPLAIRPHWGYIALTALTFMVLATLVVFTAEERKFAIWFVLGAGFAMLAFMSAGMSVVALARRLPLPAALYCDWHLLIYIGPDRPLSPLCNLLALDCQFSWR